MDDYLGNKRSYSKKVEKTVILKKNFLMENFIFCSSLV